VAIYRPARRPWRSVVLAGVTGLVVGVALGWGLLAPEPDPAEVLAEVRAGLSSAAATLEVVEIEYAESVRDGAVVAEAEYRGARDALASSRQRYAEVRDAVAALSAETASEIDASYQELERLIAAKARADEVAAVSTGLRELLHAAVAA
jgi:hypothetical protein